jgi:predicted small lipoprotein YifL
MMNSRRTGFNWLIVAAIGLMSVIGCGNSGPKMHPVKGKVELDAGEVKHLAGSNIEAALESDPTVRSSGVINEDGSFTLETLDAGVIKKGAREGFYVVRLILPDDDKDARRAAAKTLNKRFLSFETSGLALQVPASGDVVLRVSPR